MGYSHDLLPVLVVAHGIDRARALQRRLDRVPLSATAVTIDADGAVPVEPDSAVILLLPTEALAAWDVVAALHRGSSQPPVVVVAEDPDDPAVDLCLLAGARTVLDAGDPDGALVTAIDRVLRGGSPGAAIADRRRRALQRLVGGSTTPAERDRVRISALEPVARSRGRTSSDERLLGDLGPAQLAVVDGVLEGATMREIAAARGVSASATYAARQRLCARLDVRREQVEDEIVLRFGR